MGEVYTNKNSLIKNPVAVFDSGIGGLTILHECMRELPYEQYVYYADSDHIPYGIRSAEEISQLVRNAASFLDNFNPKALVLACNTATSVVVHELRAIYNYPVIGMEPAIKPATQISGEKKILVTATKRTLSEEKLERLISGLNAKDKVEKLALPELVTMSEQFNFDPAELQKYFEHVFREIDWRAFAAIVLGCTHFIYFREILRDYIPPYIQIIDGNSGTVNRLESLIIQEEKKEISEIIYFESGRKLKTNRYQKYLDYLKHDHKNIENEIL